MDRDKKLIACRINLSKRFPYMSDLIASIRVEFDKNNLSGTNGKIIIIGEGTLKSLGSGEDAELFVFTHEILHLALKHLPRFKALTVNPKEHYLCNILADYKINQIIMNNLPLSKKTRAGVEQTGVVSASLEKMLDEGLNPGWKAALDDKGYEQLDKTFKILRPFLKKDAWNMKGRPGPGDKGSKTIEGYDFGKDYTDEADENIKRQLAGGIMGAKLAGKSPGALLSELEGLWFKQEVNWRKLISSHIKTRIRQGRTWNKLHRRSFVM